MSHQRSPGPSIYVFHQFFCECCHAIILIFLLSNFTLKFYLRNPAATCGVSPSFLWSSVLVKLIRRASSLTQTPILILHDDLEHSLRLAYFFFPFIFAGISAYLRQCISKAILTHSEVLQKKNKESTIPWSMITLLTAWRSPLFLEWL